MKNSVILLGFATGILVTACNTPPHKDPGSTSETPVINDTRRNIELAKKSFEAFNKHDWKLHASYFSDSCRNLDPSYGDKYIVVSQAEKEKKYAEMQKMSPDITDSITEIFGAGDKVAIQFISKGTAKTEKGDMAWSLPICCVFTIKNGMIVTDETYYNRGN